MLSLVTVSPVITAFNSGCLSHHQKKVRGEIWPKRSEEETTQNNQDEDKKSAINKKNNSQIKKPHLKMILIKRELLEVNRNT